MLKRRTFLIGASASALVFGNSASANFHHGDAAAFFPFQPLRVGGGGFITGIDIAPDGTKVCRCDSFGAYIYQGGKWQQLCTTSRLPVSAQGALTPSGVYELRIAPSNSQVL